MSVAIAIFRVFGAKRTIILGLVFETMQLLWYGFGSQMWYELNRLFGPFTFFLQFL